MKLNPKQIKYISHVVINNLLKSGAIIIVEGQKTDVVGKVDTVITENLMIEDKLNEEVRQILETHRDEMRKNNIEYYKMFSIIKKKLIKERDLIL